MKTGNNLRKLRKSKGYTQQQMADLIHTHRTSYSKIENNQQEISMTDNVALEQLQLINELDKEEKKYYYN